MSLILNDLFERFAVRVTLLEREYIYKFAALELPEKFKSTE